jgi:predicted transglutaminase-like protease
MGDYPEKDEVENSEINELASRLKANSLEETLTNILEWQERNIEFWTERFPIMTLFWYFWLIFIIVYAYAQVFHTLLLLHLLKSQTLVIQIAVWLIQNCWWLRWIFASIFVTILLTVILVLHFIRKFPWKKIPRCLKNIITPSINFILENKLGVCTDYAKLTTCLLLNLDPKEPVYFATAPSHVATGKMIGERLYMLDQRLPILTIDRWRKYRQPRWYNKVEKFSKNGRPKKTYIPPHPSPSIDEKGLASLAMKMKKLLNVKEQTSDNVISSLRIVWKKGAILYEDDEMVNYSLARYLKLRISNELAGVDTITEIKAKFGQNNKDLVFLVRFSS